MFNLARSMRHYDLLLCGIGIFALTVAASYFNPSLSVFWSAVPLFAGVYGFVVCNILDDKTAKIRREIDLILLQDELSPEYDNESSN